MKWQWFLITKPLSKQVGHFGILPGLDVYWDYVPGELKDIYISFEFAWLCWVVKLEREYVGDE